LAIFCFLFTPHTRSSSRNPPIDPEPRVSRFLVARPQNPTPAHPRSRPNNTWRQRQRQQQQQQQQQKKMADKLTRYVYGAFETWKAVLEGNAD
jgi:hypothetical protein